MSLKSAEIFRFLDVFKLIYNVWSVIYDVEFNAKVPLTVLKIGVISAGKVI